MATPPTVVAPGEPSSRPRSRRAVALEHRRQNIMTLRYRSSTSSLRDTAAKQPEPSSTGETAVRAGKSKERNTAARHHKIARASYRLQDVDIDNWLKESMPIPPDWEYEALPPPPPGSAAAMFGGDERKHQQGYAFYHHPREEVDHIAPLNPRPGELPSPPPPAPCHVWCIAEFLF